jgi:hypothetical protein
VARPRAGARVPRALALAIPFEPVGLAFQKMRAMGSFKEGENDACAPTKSVTHPVLPGDECIRKTYFSAWATK